MEQLHYSNYEIAQDFIASAEEDFLIPESKGDEGRVEAIKSELDFFVDVEKNYQSQTAESSQVDEVSEVKEIKAKEIKAIFGDKSDKLLKNIK